MNRETLDRWCERGILAAVLAILVFGPLALGAVRATEFLIIELFAIVAVLLWAIRLWANPQLKILWPPICWAVLAFAIYAIARYLTSDIEYVARQELIRILVYALLFFVIVNNLHGQNHAQIIALTLVFLAMAISCYAIFQFATKSSQVWHYVSTYQGRGMGTYYCPNHLAGFLEMALPVALALLIASRQGHVAKIFIGYASLVIVAGIAVTVSRGSWIATGIALVIFFLLLLTRRGYRIQSALALVVLVFAALLLIPKTGNVRDRTGHLFTEKGYVEDSRFELWRPTIQMWRDNFWFGVGPGEFDHRFREYRPENIQLRPGHAHNDFLNTLADFGTVGAALVAGALALLFWGVIKTWKFVREAAGGFGKNRSNKFAVLLGASAALLAIFFHSAVDFNMHIPANAILAVTLMAILTAQLRFTTERFWATAASLKWAAGICLLAGVSYLGCQVVRQAKENLWLARADRELLFSDARMAALKKAFQAEPKNFETTYWIGEELRKEALEGNIGYEKLAREAMDWYERGMKLNPYDSAPTYNNLYYGVCLDLLDRQNESPKYFARAEELDPNSYFTMAYIGRHYVESGDFAAARAYFERSWRLQWIDNPIAESYLEIVNRRLAETAAEDRKPAF